MMSDDILEDLIVKPLGELTPMALAEIRASAEDKGIILRENPEDKHIKKILREKLEDLIMRGSPQDRAAAWLEEHPVVGTIEWHLKRADEEVRRAWEDAILSTVKAWEKGKFGTPARQELEQVIKHLGDELLPALVSAASFHVPVEPVEKPKVDAGMVIKALEKDPVLMREVREKLRAYKWDAVQGTWKIVRMEGNTTKKLTLNLPDDAPTGEYTVMLSAKEYWPGHATFAVRFHVVGGEIEGGNAASAPTFPIKRELHMDNGPNRKIIADVQGGIDGYLRGVRLEAIPRG